MKPFQFASVLLQYPDEETASAGCELAEAAQEIDDRSARRSAERFLEYWESNSCVVLQDAYVSTFDFDRRASLYLTYHTHGDRRQRGLELLRLKRRYADAGLTPPADELPDYLPVCLEYAAVAGEDGETLLAELREPIELLRSHLSDKKSPYVHLLDAVCTVLPRLRRDQMEAIQQLAQEGPPTELVGLEPFGQPEPEPAFTSEGAR